ncbi:MULTISPECIES: GvpL/GvpF family gas vesicle protein [Streptomyces]|uniref:GvpL/GvpF family gas vesicle protein n=2 Tax=Streptomyces TaxID=1883 RepID=A0ABV9J4Z8_9ACTN
MTALRYVYAVCRPLGSPLPAGLTGVEGDPPTLLAHRGMVAVVGRVAEEDFAEEPLRRHLEDLDWLAATARAHAQVVEALTAVTTLLPLRLATVFRDDDGVRLMLEEREDDLRRTLDRLADRVEWGVKVYVEAGTEAEAATETAGTGPSANRPASGRDYLMRRRRSTRAREDAWQRAEELAGRLHATLRTRAESSRLHPPQHPALSRTTGQNVLNAAYLVPRSDSEEFVETVSGIKGEEPGTRVELTGPWAAYSFVDTEGVDTESDVDTESEEKTTGEERQR